MDDAPRPGLEQFEEEVETVNEGIEKRDGVISHYEGVDELHKRYDEWILDAHLPPPGSPTRPVEAGYMANAWVRMRHTSYETLREMLDDVGRTLKVRAR